MALRIANNIAAMTTQRWLGVSDAGMKKSLERLSSGYRINKAADDAAGLAISQSFRADIASFKVAQRNVSEANSLLQVAEGGLDQIGNMLTRMKELATQASSSNSGSNLDKINAEYSQLMLEIDRIVNSSEYADTALLDGTFGASLTGALGDSGAFQGIIDDDADNIQYTVAGAGLEAQAAVVTAFGSSTDEGAWAIDRVDDTTISIGNGSVTENLDIGAAGTTTISFASLGITITTDAALTANQLAADSITILKTGLTDLNVSSAAAATYTIADSVANTITIGNGTITETVTGFTAGQAAQTLDFSMLGISFTLGTDYDDADLHETEIVVTSGGTGASFQVGAENNTDNQISFSISSANTDDIGTASGGTATNLYGTAVSSAILAQDAMTVIDKAIDDINTIRGTIGANQNRMGYAAANIASTMENLTAAESVIRDVDMASEMTTFTKNQILLQAGTAMLAQANMAPQQVLALFG